MTPKRTPLYGSYIARNVNLRDAGGYFTPTAFSDARTEHIATREAAGLFEIFGQFLVEVTGERAKDFMDSIFLADIGKLGNGRVTYTSLLNDLGGLIDDLTLFRVNSAKFYVVSAPHRVDIVEALLAERAPAFNINVISLGYKYTSLSLQGPKSREILQSLTDIDLATRTLPAFSFRFGTLAGFTDTLVSRTGFTGELGYELFIRTERVEDAYEQLLAAGADKGLLPCGVSALTSLRIEKRYPIYGRDLNDTITPVEAGLAWTVRDKAADYPGKEVVMRQKASGVDRMLVLLQLPADAGLPVAGAVVDHDGTQVGHVTSAGMGHTVGCPLAMAFVRADLARDGETVEIVGHSTATVRPRAVYDPTSSRARI